ncbi:class I SAM-dependent methyltransferase [Oscillatoriales cyanobacterium LEGE 11467]|uniref:Class I SAM-dependent methyltransferase n=1 Tax=Zarconia navalis LEGE 11467 TaxID=1828826 RepID=A0A928VSH0_9CYAN|nr:class I SAM-dependent methyltransferase [Zarconia navalis]MBE9039447.1 class I SAM-dependent methyltransferase [Zarconia navalis LEGE 11467]
MNILVFAPYAINTPHFETELEIIQKHLDVGDKVTAIGCNANLKACDANFAHYYLQCLNCISRRIEGLKLLSQSIPVKPLYNLTEQNKREIESLPTSFSSLEELKRFTIDNFDLGFAVLSSLISAMRDPEPDLAKDRVIVEKLMKPSLAAYRSIQNYLSAGNFDRVYVYNGRYVPMRAAFRACQSQEVDCFLHEKGRTLNHYNLWKNSLPHDIAYTEKLIRNVWSLSNDISSQEKIASGFFLDRIQGISRTWYSYTKEQEQGLLPKTWDDEKINLVIFNSSEDEFSSIGDQWKNPLYESQYEGLRKIIESVKDDERLHLYLRVHPNLKNVQNKQIDQINALKAPNLTVIPPDSPVSSYTLLKNSSKVVTFGSTMGIEAVYWGIPSILAGQSFYRNLGGTYNPKTHEELLELLYAKLPPKEKTAALMYGYYFSTWGISFKYYEALGIYEGKFKGVRIQPKITVDLVVSQALEELNVNQHPDIALSLFDRAIAAQPNVPGLQYGKAVALARMERTAEAIETLQALLSVMPAHRQARGLLDELQPVRERVIDDAEFQEFLPIIRPHTSLSDASLYSLFSRAKQVCEQNIPGNFIELGIEGGGETALIAVAIKRYSKQKRWVYAFDEKNNATVAKVREIWAKLGVTDIVKPISGNIRETVPKMRYIVGVLALVHLNLEDDSIAKTILDILYSHIANDALIQIDRYRHSGGSHRALQELAAARQIQFNLNAIDTTSVWFQKPDRYPVNSILNLELVKNFTEDDSTNYGIQSQMSINERFQLYYALRELLPRLPSPFRFVEIGSWAGGSLLLICKALKRMTPSVQGISIDPGGLPQLHQVLQYLQNDVRHLRMFSHQAVPHLKQFFDRDGNLPTFMFIDGDHTYEGVRRDIIDYFPLLAPGGLMVFHDYLPPLDLQNRESILFHHAGNEPGIRQACQEVMEATYGCEVVNIPLLYPTDPASTDASLPIIPGVSSTLRVYRKPL